MVDATYCEAIFLHVDLSGSSKLDLYKMFSMVQMW